MSDTEEYLDDLLGSLSENNKSEKAEDMTGEMPEAIEEQNVTEDLADLDLGGNSSEDEAFLKQFEQELVGTPEDDLMRQFEQELGTDQEQKEDAVTDDTEALIADLDDILNGSGGSEEQDADLAEPEVPEMEQGAAQADMNDMGSSDEDLMALLSGMTGSDELADADISSGMPAAEPKMEPEQPVEFQAAEQNDGLTEDLFGLGSLDGMGDGGIFGEEEAVVPDAAEEKEEKKTSKDKDKKAKKEGEKKEGFLQKLSLILFGEDDEEEELSADDENKKLLKELDAAGETDAGAVKPEDKKARKKREKAEKKEQKKQEQEAKKAEKAKKAASKPKKEKKPKEKDNTPPLPKKPVILIAVMAASIFALIQLGSNAVGYSLSKGDAKDAYRQGDYVDAYAKLEGMEIKEADEAFYNKIALLAAIQEEYDSYQSMMQIGEPEMALDCLIRGIGRCSNHAERAEEYGVTPEVNGLKGEMIQILTGTFGVDEQQALDIYKLRSRTEYTLELKKILKAAGME